MASFKDIKKKELVKNDSLMKYEIKYLSSKVDMTEDILVLNNKHTEFYSLLNDTCTLQDSNDFSITGLRGSGKTSISLFFVNDIVEEAKKNGIIVGSFFVNCVKNNKVLGAFNSLADRNSKATSKSVDEFSKITKKNDYNIVILDEADSMEAKELIKTIYLLKNEIKNLTIICTGISGKIFDMIQKDPSVESRFQPKPISFSDYSIEHIEEIINLRLKKVYGKNDSTKDYSKVLAELIENYLDRDLRIGLNAIYDFNKVEISKSSEFETLYDFPIDKISRKFKSYCDKAKVNFYKDLYGGFNNRQLLILLCLAYLEEQDPSFADTRRAFEILRLDSKFDVKKIDRKTFERDIPKFTAGGHDILLIDEKRRGSSSVKTLKFTNPNDKEILFQSFKNRFGLSDSDLERYKNQILKKEIELNLHNFQEENKRFEEFKFQLCRYINHLNTINDPNFKNSVNGEKYFYINKKGKSKDIHINIKNSFALFSNTLNFAKDSSHKFEEDFMKLDYDENLLRLVSRKLIRENGSLFTLSQNMKDLDMTTPTYIIKEKEYNKYK